MSASGVPLADWPGREPRLSPQQQRALADLVCHDQHASILGFDWSYLPVVEAILGEPSRVRRYSIGRDGSPCPVNYGRTDSSGGLLGDGAEHGGGKLLESWTAAPFVKGDPVLVIEDVEYTGGLLRAGQRAAIDIVIKGDPSSVGIRWRDDEGNHVLAIATEKLRPA